MHDSTILEVLDYFRKMDHMDVYDEDKLTEHLHSTYSLQFTNQVMKCAYDIHAHEIRK